ncbi:MAG: hypothetical protein AABZ39_11835 [Spirochaetota bacterium]
MKRAFQRTSLAAIMLAATCFHPLFGASSGTNWRIDDNATALEIVKLGMITAVPIALFLAAGFGSPEYRLPFIIAGSVTSVPAIAGITLFTIDIINYDPNKDPSITMAGTEIRASIRFYF